MKNKKLSKKLSLNKETISLLNEQTLNINGGLRANTTTLDEPTVLGQSCNRCTYAECPTFYCP